MMTARIVRSGFTVGLLLCAGAHAQTYPSKPVRIVLPYPPGAGTDLHARALAQKLTDNLGQPVIVDNRGGANGVLAMEFAARSAPDGYTLVYALPAQYSVNPALYPRLAQSRGVTCVECSGFAASLRERSDRCDWQHA